MRVLLIDPPFGSRQIGGKNASFAGVANIIPSLGLGYLAAIAEQEGHEVRVVDGAREVGQDAMMDMAHAFMPEIVGITATTPTFKNAVDVIAALRRTLPKAAYIAGGPHITSMPEQAAEARVFDYLVIGEGEDTFRELLRCIGCCGEASVEKVPGLMIHSNGKRLFTGHREHINDLDSIPFPARHLFPPLTFYRPTPASYRKLPLAHIITSRGCPVKCSFCDKAVFGDKYRERSAKNVLSEVRELVDRYGAREIRFFDDTFTINKTRLTEICEGMKRIRPRIPWTCLTNVNFVKPDILRMMRDAGCWQVLYGLESGDDSVLKTLGKCTSVEKNRCAVSWAREARMRVRADFIVGTPSETVQTLANTLSFAEELPIDFAHFNKFVPFPGTEFYNQLKGEGYVFDFSNSSTLDHDALVFVPSGIAKETYRRFLDTAYKKFYLRPRYLLRRIFAIRTLTELWANIRGFFSIISLGH